MNNENKIKFTWKFVGNPICDRSILTLLLCKKKRKCKQNFKGLKDDCTAKAIVDCCITSYVCSL